MVTLLAASLNEEKPSSTQFGGVMVEEANANAKTQQFLTTSPLKNIDAIRSKFQGSALPYNHMLDRKASTTLKSGKEGLTTTSSSPDPAPSSASPVKPPNNRFPRKSLPSDKEMEDFHAAGHDNFEYHSPVKEARKKFSYTKVTTPPPPTTTTTTSSKPNAEGARRHSLQVSPQQPKFHNYLQPTVVRNVVETSDAYDADNDDDDDRSKSSARTWKQRRQAVDKKEETSKPLTPLPPASPMSVTMTPNQFPRKSVTDISRRGTLIRLTSPISNDALTKMGDQVSSPKRGVGSNDADVTLTLASPSLEENFRASISGNVSPAVTSSPQKVMQDFRSAGDGENVGGYYSPVKEVRKKFERRATTSTVIKPSGEGVRRMSLQVPTNQISPNNSNNKKEDTERQKISRNTRRWTVDGGSLEGARKKAISEVLKENEGAYVPAYLRRSSELGRSTTLTTTIEFDAEELVEIPSDSPIAPQVDLHNSVRNDQPTSSPLRRIVVTPKYQESESELHEIATSDSVVPTPKPKQMLQDNNHSVDSPENPLTYYEVVGVSPQQKRRESSEQTKGQDPPNFSGSKQTLENNHSTDSPETPAVAADEESKLVGVSPDKKKESSGQTTGQDAPESTNKMLVEDNHSANFQTPAASDEEKKVVGVSPQESSGQTKGQDSPKFSVEQLLEENNHSTNSSQIPSVASDEERKLVRDSAKSSVSKQNLVEDNHSANSSQTPEVAHDEERKIVVVSPQEQKKGSLGQTKGQDSPKCSGEKQMLIEDHQQERSGQTKGHDTSKSCGAQQMLEESNHSINTSQIPDVASDEERKLDNVSPQEKERESVGQIKSHDSPKSSGAKQMVVEHNHSAIPPQTPTVTSDEEKKIVGASPQKKKKGSSRQTKAHDSSKSSAAKQMLVEDNPLANSSTTPVATGSDEERKIVAVSLKKKKKESSRPTKGQDSPKGRSSIVESAENEKALRTKHEGTDTHKVNTKNNESSRHSRKSQIPPKSEKNTEESKNSAATHEVSKADKEVKKKKGHTSEGTNAQPKPLKGSALKRFVRNAVENKEPKNCSGILRPPKNVFQRPIKVPEDYKPPVYPKTKQEEKTIRKALERSFIFHHLPENTKKALTCAFENSQVPSGSIIIRQGEMNKSFYVVAEGECEFTVDGKQVGKVKTGESFGEDSLLCSSYSKASITTSADSKVFKIDQTSFRNLLESETKKSGRRKRELLQNVDFLEGMSSQNIQKLCDLMVTVKFKEGDVLVGKDDYGKSFFVISEGKVECKDVKHGKISKPNHTLAAGDYFGKDALIEDVPLTKANVVALTEGQAYKIDRDKKDAAMGIGTRFPLDARTLHVLGVFDRKPGKALKPSEIVQLSNCIQDQIFYKGDTILEEGVETEAAIYFVRAGKVHCHLNRGFLVVTPGSHFGEDLFQYAKNKKQITAVSSGKATAEEDCICGVLSIRDYFNLFGDDVLKSIPIEKPKVAKEAKAKIMKESKPEEDVTILDTPKVVQSHVPLLSDLEKRVCLGEGQFGQVWLTVDKTVSEMRPYVLKIQSKYDLVSEGEAEVCIREKNVLRDVSHPLIIDLIATYQDEKFVFILLEFVQGGELYSLMNTNECRVRLKESQAKFYALGMADALAYLHEKKYVYRDIKPENILIDSMGYPKLIDFGFAKKVMERTFTLCGTPGYLAPELVLSQGHSFPVDHWALGVLIYEMLSESSPFFESGIDQFELFRSIAEDDYPVIDGISPEASSLIASLLKKNPTERHGSLARGERDILCHDWFNDLHVKQLRERQLAAPWTPQVKDVLDTSNFDDWSDVQDKMLCDTPPLRPKHAALFTDF